jgi:hypothetical protein
VKRHLELAAMGVMSPTIVSGAATCAHYPFKIAVLRAKVSQSLLHKGVTQAEVY